MWSLNKRIPRNVKSNLQRWIPMFILFSVSMYIIVSLLGFSDIVIFNARKYYDDTHVETGEFSTFVELAESDIEKIDEMGFKVEKNFYIDYPVFEDARLRVHRVRNEINLIKVELGKLPEEDGEVIIEKNFADANDIQINDTVTIGGIDFKVSGIGCSPDYEQVLQNLSEAGQNVEKFGTAFVTEVGYDELKKMGGGLCTEEYLYSFLNKDDSVNSEDLKEYLCDLQFDQDKIEDKYFIEMLDDVLADKVEFENAISNLSDAADELSDVSAEFEDGANELKDACDDFCEGVEQLVDGVDKIDEGVNTISENSDELVSGAESVFDYFIANANSQLSQNGIDIELTRSNYKEQLSNVDTANVASGFVNRINELQSSLEAVETFYNGVVAYTNGVGGLASAYPAVGESMQRLSDASQQFSDGIGAVKPTDENLEAIMILQGIRENYGGINQGLKDTTSGLNTFAAGLSDLNSNSEQLSQGASQIFNMLLSTVSQQLSEYGLNVSLNSGNYRSELDNLRNNADQLFSDTLSDSFNDLSSAISEYETFYDGLEEYTDAISELQSGVNEMKEETADITDYTNSLRENSEDFVSYAEELRESTDELSSRVSDFEDDMDIIDKYFTIDINNLTSFMNADENGRIQLIEVVAQRTELEGIICGIVILILLVYVLSIFVIQEITQESTVIGALYSMGVKRKELLIHYVTIPMIISFLGGLTGMLLGYSKFGVDFQLNDVLRYYSLPDMENRVNVVVVILCILVPPIIAFIVSSISIYSRLSRSPLSLLRKEQKPVKIRNVNLDKLGFMNNFRVKQIINESKTSVAVFVGMFLPMILVILSINYFVCLDKLQSKVKDEVTYDYVYTIKYMPSEIPENGYEAYAESFTTEYMGMDLNVSLTGVQPDNPFFEILDKQNCITIGTGIARKLGLGTDDSLTLYNSQNKRYYTFQIAGVCEYDLGLSAFMNIDDMRDIFGRDEDFYNIIYSKEEIDIDSGRLYTITTNEKINKMIDDFCGSLGAVVYMLVFGAILIFVVVTFLMIKLMLDHATLNISMMKIFGFSTKEIRKLYIDGNFITIFVSALISIPGAKLFVDKFWFPLMNADLEYGFDVKYNPLLYLIIFAVIMVLYFIISFILRRRINAISMVEILKCRE